MASSRDRQRKLARAKLDRQLARRASRARRRRQIQAGVGAAAALLLIVAGSVWLLGGFDGKPSTPEAADDCVWTPQSATANANLKDVGTPPVKDIPEDGTRPMTITTNQGAPITVSLDLAASPCGAASLAYLASRNFFNNTTCHEITTEGALRCGDPSGTGLGGPTYSFPDENSPQAPEPQPSGAPPAKQPPLYPRGTVAFVGNPPGVFGSQFLIFFKDFTTADPRYSIVGKVTAGMDVLTKIAALPTVADANGEKVKPKTKILVQSVTVGEVAGTSAAEPPAAPSGAAPAPSASGRS